MIIMPSCRLQFVVLLCAGALLVTGPGVAQSPKVQPGENLSLEARRVLDRLAGLAQLPPGSWKMHAGDIMHGERVDLDDSGWQPVAMHEKTPTSALWFRQTFEIPPTLDGYDLTGARIWFQFHAAANGPMPEIIYFNGRRVAMGEDLEPIVLLDGAKVGDKVVVAVKLLETVDVKQFRGPASPYCRHGLEGFNAGLHWQVPSREPDAPGQRCTSCWATLRRRT